MTWGVIYVLLWFYRCIYSVLAETVISRLTSLGDTAQYADTLVERPLSGLAVGFSNPRYAATALAENLGALFTTISGGLPYFASICFQTIAFAGIVSLLRAAPHRLRLLLLPFLMLPSFSIWSSVSGKEALVVFGVGILSALAIRMYNGEYRIGLIHILAIVIVALAKNQYLPALAFLLVGTYIARAVRQHASLTLWAGFLSLVMLYLVRDQVSSMIVDVAMHFDGLGSSRPPFWSQPSDALTKAPLGMLLAFFGPTLSEASSGILQMITFVESSILLGLLVLVLLIRLPTMPVYMALMGGFTLFWILFAAYPLGVMNAGSAIRYRTGHQILIMALVVIIMSREQYVSWRKHRPPQLRRTPMSSM